MDLATIEESLQDYLGGITTNINTVIGESNPAGLDESQSQILEQLSTGTFPASSVSLLSFIRSKLAVDFSEGNTSKELSYYDTLLFALYWKNLNNISAKYKFIFEQYLSDSFSRDDIHYGLPKSKTSYEVAYI
ncbi:MAG: hypothetical protein H6767_06825 [Candidatus Peribacteria bacterium]|nr:MAG: hypothetical protein H6767_06825 [Candidatus Peribacteria bacterium]